MSENGPLTAREAQDAIRAILARIPDAALPPLRIEQDSDGTVIAWNGDTGRYLGSAKRRGRREPDVNRSGGIWDAIEREAVARLDEQFHANGDSLDGLGWEVRQR